MTTTAESSLKEVLKAQFGYDDFRPYQQEIIESILKKQDTLAVLPTGGGKSLCFQLPATMNQGLTLVVSPLIALMKDQVDSLDANGVPSTFINSSLSNQEIDEKLSKLNQGKYRLLFVAPERLMMPGFLSQARRWSIDLIAIDEAHCISEWGHDFRPEYRQLSLLKELFPSVPILALTATATQRVRDDIVQQLHFDTSKQFIASFNRPNLTYRVLPKHKGIDQLVAFLRDRPDQSGIVYCLARKTCEQLAKRLNSEGISARPYHAGLDSNRRTRNQDAFLKDNVRVICATIAFGMGIHKSNVRFVVHFNLPRNIESYYQETGRAGRDGLPSECLFLYSPGDASKLLRFIADKPDPEERMKAKSQLNTMLAYSESSDCRRKVLLFYFGENWETMPCGACDNCLEPREVFDGTTPAQKLLSCVYRIREKSGFSVGLHYTVDVLMGKTSEKIQKWKHDEISTFGIGEEYKKREWVTFGQELLRKGYLSQAENEFKVIQLTEKGKEALVNKTPIELTKPLTSIKPKAEIKSDESYDPELFNSLRVLRKSLADQRDVPAYIIFSDATLREMARDCPITLNDFAQISGVGKRKLKEFSAPFIDLIKEYLLGVNLEASE